MSAIKDQSVESTTDFVHFSLSGNKVVIAHIECHGCGVTGRCVKSECQDHYYCSECIAIGGGRCANCVYYSSEIPGVFVCLNCEDDLGPAEEYEPTPVDSDLIKIIDEIIDTMIQHTTIKNVANNDKAVIVRQTNCHGCDKVCQCVLSWFQTNYYCSRCIVVGGGTCGNCVFYGSKTEGIFVCSNCEDELGPADEYQPSTQVDTDQVDEINECISIQIKYNIVTVQ